MLRLYSFRKLNEKKKQQHSIELHCVPLKFGISLNLISNFFLRWLLIVLAISRVQQPTNTFRYQRREAIGDVHTNDKCTHLHVCVYTVNARAHPHACMIRKFWRFRVRIIILSLCECVCVRVWQRSKLLKSGETFQLSLVHIACMWNEETNLYCFISLFDESSSVKIIT